MTTVKKKVNTVKATVKATKDKMNPFLATSEDGLNEAFGKTKEEALKNLEKGIELRKQTNG